MLIKYDRQRPFTLATNRNGFECFTVRSQPENRCLVVCHVHTTRFALHFLTILLMSLESFEGIVSRHILSLSHSQSVRLSLSCKAHRLQSVNFTSLSVLPLSFILRISYLPLVRISRFFGCTNTLLSVDILSVLFRCEYTLSRHRGSYISFYALNRANLPVVQLCNICIYSLFPFLFIIRLISSFHALFATFVFIRA